MTREKIQQELEEQISNMTDINILGIIPEWKLKNYITAVETNEITMEELVRFLVLKYN